MMQFLKRLPVNLFFSLQPTSKKMEALSINETPSVKKRRTLFPGKEKCGLSFNLTALGRHLLKEQAEQMNVSIADYVELLIRERKPLPPLQLDRESKVTGPKGGARSYYFGKNRGTTTAISATAEARRMLNDQVRESRMSRGDYIEYLLRDKAQLLDEPAAASEMVATLEVGAPTAIKSKIVVVPQILDVRVSPDQRQLELSPNDN